MKIISGGQTGVDQIGLEMARRHGIPTGGTAPLGFRTENGSQSEYLKSFGLVESQSVFYPIRTQKNVADSDGTVIFGNLRSAGSRLTIKCCREEKKPYIENPNSVQLLQWIRNHNIQVLNVAGNRASNLSESHKQLTETTLDESFKRIAGCDEN